jgi:hypothetical protein
MKLECFSSSPTGRKTIALTNPIHNTDQYRPILTHAMIAIQAMQSKTHLAKMKGYAILPASLETCSNTPVDPPVVERYIPTIGSQQIP